MRMSVAAVVFCVSAPILAAQAAPKQKDAAPAKPKLAVLEFAGTNELKFAALQNPDVTIPLTIENRGTMEVKDIRVTLTRFFGSGRSVDPGLSEAPFTLAPGKQHAVTVNMTMPVATTYKAELRVDAGAEIAVTGTIVIERKYAKAPLVIGTIATRLVTTLLPFDTTVDVPIQTTGDTVTLRPPILESVMLKDKPSATYSVAAPEVMFDPPPDKPLTVSDAPDQRLKLTLKNLRKAGVYEAIFRLGGKGFEDTPLKITVYVREPGWVLLLIVAIGVGLSFFLRTYTSVLRPRRLNERRVATLYRELDEHAQLAGEDAGALNVVQQVRRTLTTRYNDLSAAATLTDPTSFTVYDDKIDLLPLWIALRKRVATLQPETLQKPFEDRLTASAQVLLDTNADANAVHAQTSDLQKMPIDIDAEIKKALRAQLDTFRAELAKDSRDEVKPIVNALQGVETDLTDGKLARAASRLDALQRSYVRILAEELSRRLSSTPPIGVLERDWPATLGMITAGLAQARAGATAAEATERFRAALTLFLNTALAGLRLSLVDHLKNATQKNKSVYQGIEPSVTEVGTLIAKGDLLAAWKKLAETEAAYRTAIDTATSGSMGANDAAGLDSLQAMAAPASSAGDLIMTWIFGGGTSSEVLQRKDSMRTIDKSIRRTDLFVTVVIFLIAVALGFKTLWADNLTWGGWMSYLIAFLWGVGFDQFGHAGLSALINKA